MSGGLISTFGQARTATAARICEGRIPAQLIAQYEKLTETHGVKKLGGNNRSKEM